MGNSHSTPTADVVLAALAVIGRADAQVLAAVLSGAGSSTLAEIGLEALVSHPAIQEQDGWFTLEPGAASTILADLKREDFSRYRQLHEHAIAYLAGWLRAGDQAVESIFLAVFRRLVDDLLLDDPEGFAVLVGSVRDVPLVEVAGQQLRRFYEGLALSLADRYAEALAVFDALLAEPGLDEQVRGRVLNSRANCCHYTGRLEEALADFRASLELWRRLGNRLRQGIALLNLGIVAYDLQEHKDAESNLTQAAQCFEETSSFQWLAAAQNELGLVYRDQGRWSEALARFEAAAAHYTAEGAQDPLGRVLNNMGEVLLFQGHLDEAAASFQKALTAMRTRLYAVDTHINLGLAHQAAGDLPGAQAAFQDALNLALSIGRRDILAEVHLRLGEALRLQSEDEAALMQFTAGVEVIEATREPLHAEELKISLLGRWQQVYEALVHHCLAMDHPADAFEWAERARARAFDDAVLQSHLSSSDSVALAKDKEGTLDRSPVVTVTEVQAALPVDTALLCYFTTGVLDRGLPLLRALPADNPLRDHLLTPARTLLFAITRASLSVHDCAIDPNAFTSASPRKGAGARFAPAPTGLLTSAVLRRLHAALLKPAGDALEVRRLYIVPHGPLHHVPFGALTDQNGRSLLHDGGPHLAYAPSATVLVRHCLAPEPEATAHEPCLTVGYAGAQGERVLRHTEAEANFVASVTSGEAWIGPLPKKEQVRLAAPDHRWLHFACHGQFIYETPMDSYLETGEGERLTALEVIQHWRLQAELVTLSACQTGVSRVLRGDEPMGLIRAFLYAGAKATLVSQWPVEDVPTFLLMQRFYEEMQGAQRGDPAGALHSAQVWLSELTTVQVRRLMTVLPTGGPPEREFDLLAELPPDMHPFDHPRYWAAFVLVGGAAS